VFLFALLVALAVLGFFVVFLFTFQRDARREVVIFERALEGDLEEAAALATRWDQGRGPTNPVARLRLARSQWKAGDPHRALVILAETKLPKGRLARPIRQMASELRFDVLEALGEQEQAARVINETIDEDPGTPWLLKTGTTSWVPSPASHSLWAQGKLVKDSLQGLPDEAAELTEALITRAARGPFKLMGSHFGYLLIGSAQMAAGQDSAAEASFQQFVAKASDQAAAKRLIARTRAEALLKGGRFSEATSAYEAFAADQPTAEAFAGLAMCHMRVGKTDQAERELDRAVELGYGEDNARFIRAQVLADQGRNEEAVTLAREAARSRPPSDLLGTYTLGYVLATTLHPDAEAALRRHMELDPNDPDLPPLLERPAPNGSTWREYLGSAPAPDL
jgi:tetratricopeptide (TPR) repeat protein